MGARAQRGLGQPLERVHERVRVPPNASLQLAPPRERLVRQHVGAHRARRRRRPEEPGRVLHQRRARGRQRRSRRHS